MDFNTPRKYPNRKNGMFMEEVFERLTKYCPFYLIYWIIMFIENKKKIQFTPYMHSPLATPNNRNTLPSIRSNTPGFYDIIPQQSQVVPIPSIYNTQNPYKFDFFFLRSSSELFNQIKFSCSSLKCWFESINPTTGSTARIACTCQRELKSDSQWGNNATAKRAGQFNAQKSGNHTRRTSGKTTAWSVASICAWELHTNQVGSMNFDMQTRSWTVNTCFCHCDCSNRMMRAEETIQEGRNTMQSLLLQTKSLELNVSNSQRDMLVRNQYNRLDELKLQIDDLQRSKENLDRSAHSLIDEIKALKNKVDIETLNFNSLSSDLRNKTRRLEEGQQEHVKIFCFNLDKYSAQIQRVVLVFQDWTI